MSNTVVRKSGSRTPSKKRLPNIVDANNFNIQNLIIPKVDKNFKYNNKNQYIAFPKYRYSSTNEENLFIRTGPIKIVQHGIFRIDNEYTKEDKDRQFIRIPYDESQEACVELFKLFEKIDDYCRKNQKKIVDPIKKNFKYEYSPIIRKPMADDPKIMKYAKINFAVNYETKRLDTKVFTRDNGKPELCEGVHTMTDLEEYVRFLGTYQFAISLFKFWAMKRPMDANQPAKFGVSFKCHQVDVIELPQGGVKYDFGKSLFDDTNNDSQSVDDDSESKDNQEKESTVESDSEEKKSNKSSKKSSKKKKKNVEPESDSDTDSDDSDSDDEVDIDSDDTDTDTDSDSDSDDE